MTMTPDYSAEKLAEFLTMLAAKGLMNRNSAVALKGSAAKVLGVLEPHEREDLRDLDKELAFQRFQNLQGTKYTPESLTTYKSRFVTAVDEFVAYTSDPASYKSAGKRHTNGSAGKEKNSPTRTQRKRSADPRSDASSHQIDGGMSPSVYKNDLMVPIPLRDGVMVKVMGLPVDLSQDEAKKIGAVVLAYAVS